MARNYAALPHEYLEEWENLTEAEVGRLVIALLKYSATGEIVKLSGNEKYLFPRVRAQEDRYRASYDDTSSKRSEAGKKGAEKRWHGKAKDSKAINAMAKDSKNGYTETDTDTETEDIAPPAPPAHAREPEPKEIETSCSEIPNSSPPEPEPPADPICNQELRQVMDFYMENICKAVPSSVTTQSIRDFTAEMGPDIVLHALRLAAEAEAHDWRYAKRILERYRDSGIKTMEAVQEDEMRSKQRKGRREKPSAPKTGGGFALVDLDGDTGGSGGLVDDFGRGRYA